MLKKRVRLTIIYLHFLLSRTNVNPAPEENVLIDDGEVWRGGAADLAHLQDYSGRPEDWVSPAGSPRARQEPGYTLLSE